MTKDVYRIFVINTGSTSTKVALYENDKEIQRKELIVPKEEIDKAARTVDQLPYRTKVVKEFMDEAGISIDSLDIIAARGGPICSYGAGAYLVNDLMVDILTYAAASAHESGLSCMIGRELAKGYDLPVIIYDGVMADEYQPEAQISGLPELKFVSRGHPLNARKVARETAKKLGRPLEECRMVVAHLGGSISISGFNNGKLVDMYHAYNGAPMSPQRAGNVVSLDLMDMAYSGEYPTKADLNKKINGNSGLYAYFGTQNAKDVMDMIEAGDEKAKQVVEAMAYQCGKCIGAMAVAAGGNIDRIIFTGGIAYSKLFVGMVTKWVEFLAPVEVMPGEFEMAALAEGGLRVLRGQDKAKEFDCLPAGISTKDEFYATKVAPQKAQGL